MEQKRDEKKARATRARARRKMDAEGVNRKGKDIDHVIPLSKGGSNAPSNLRLTSPSDNRSFKRNPDRSVKKNT
jgi:5-methylcytosine-specific restriction endonuclease McrA